MRVYIIYLIFCALLAAGELIRPIPLSVDVNEEKASLGKKLFFDTRLSTDDTISCQSCHNIMDGGADYFAFSVGVNGRKGAMNSPTVFNSRYNIAQFWDGRAADLQEQAKGPILNHVEMASSEDEVVAKLLKDQEYVNSFAKLYGDGITLSNIADSIAEFEKTLITPNSKFDKFLRGDDASMNGEEKDGYRLFKNFGCIACHNGINIGSNMFQRFGVFMEDNNTNSALGRYSVTKKENDKYFFKVPTLRNVSKTAPYFHNGSAKTLEDAVKTMGLYQLGRELEIDEIKKLVLFLKTLDGQYENND